MYIPSNLSKNEDKLEISSADEKTNSTPHNITYIDKSENLIRLPTMKKYYDDKKSIRKSQKKSPKRTIQKIIKKNRAKIRKLYVMKMTSDSTMVPKSYENAQDDYSPRRDETTTPSNQRKRMKKYNNKLPRYPMPFHQMHKNFKRDKRQARDLFILKDFDDIKFLKEKNDYNVVSAHFKKYW
ncbi:hypothetical protein HW555_009801 [Spodoptera exigua]|uniref:Uncharacterized protein n=1 Tax=Spodoptera exigua TaxID=7107 RepID=A0A835G8I4_SPOEX|nr:hypothetical protein HW555_009801 [Spodoptera exigua]